MTPFRTLILAAVAALVLAAPAASAEAVSADVAVAPQYDTTHVYVAPEDFDRFVASIIATFGGKTTPQGVFTVTPTPSLTMSQLILTPVGSISVFGFRTPIPYPFGVERTGYLVADMDRAVAAARAAGADVLVEAFPDPIGRDAIVQWPGGVNMQLYWHTTPPAYPALETVPENRVYVSPARADGFVRDFVAFAHGKVVSDDRRTAGEVIGRPHTTFRQIRVESKFGRLVVLVTDGHLAWPYGRELTGYQVANLDETLAKAKAAGAAVLVQPYTGDGRSAAIVQFPGGYIAEIHAPQAP